MPMVIGGREVTDKDLGQRYEGTYIRIQVPSVPDPFVAYINGIGRGNLSNDVAPAPMDRTKIVEDFPPLGAVNYDGAVHFLRRRPLRQWSRGLSPNVLEDFCRDGSAQGFSSHIDKKRAEAVFNRVWITPEEGLPKIKKEEFHSFAVDPRYWYSGNRRNVYLWRDTVCLGQILGKRIFFMPQSNLLKQEVKDEIGGQYEVV
jgi:hypothetical protein